MTFQWLVTKPCWTRPGCNCRLRKISPTTGTFIHSSLVVRNRPKVYAFVLVWCQPIVIGIQLMRCLGRSDNNQTFDLCPSTQAKESQWVTFNHWIRAFPNNGREDTRWSCVNKQLYCFISFESPGCLHDTYMQEQQHLCKWVTHYVNLRHDHKPIEPHCNKSHWMCILCTFFYVIVCVRVCFATNDVLF